MTTRRRWVNKQHIEQSSLSFHNSYEIFRSAKAFPARLVKYLKLQLLKMLFDWKASNTMVKKVSIWLANERRLRFFSMRIENQRRNTHVKHEVEPCKRKFGESTKAFGEKIRAQHKYRYWILIFFSLFDLFWAWLDTDSSITIFVRSFSPHHRRAVRRVRKRLRPWHHLSRASNNVIENHLIIKVVASHTSSSE